MLKKKFGRALSVILLCLPFGMMAQSYSESALLFSRTQPGGSARVQAIGGAQVALGGDYSSALSNPAGLGMYNRSEFTLTPALTSYSTNSTWDGIDHKETESIFNVPGLSLVLNIPRENNGFQGGSFSISMTRTNDFNSNLVYSGRNTENSMVDYFLEQANGDTPEQFDTYHYNDPIGLSYYTYLIGPQSILDPPGPDDRYFTDAPVESDQQEVIQTKGTSHQWSFSYGANYKDILFFGGGLGLSTIRFESVKNFSEMYVDQSIVEEMFLTENLEVRGSGINATLGVIVRPVEFLQVGVSFVTPTAYQLTETYDASMEVNWNNYDYWDGSDFVNLSYETASTDIVTSDYSLTTPLKLSAGLVLKSRYGFISGDVEMMNPAKARYKSEDPGISFGNENTEISDSFDKVLNYRAGFELRYEMFRLRGGYSFQGSPFKNTEYGGEIKTISGGVGVRWEKFFMDFALIQRESENNYSPYVLSDNRQPVIGLTHKTLTSMITLGLTW
jgi:hypothetical protein